MWLWIVLAVAVMVAGMAGYVRGRYHRELRARVARSKVEVLGDQNGEKRWHVIEMDPDGLAGHALCWSTEGYHEDDDLRRGMEATLEALARRKLDRPMARCPGCDSPVNFDRFLRSEPFKLALALMRPECRRGDGYVTAAALRKYLGTA